MSLRNYFLFVSIFLCVCDLKLAANDYPRRCEQSSGSISKTGIINRAMQGHSFKNYTLSKPYDCHVKCFEERCKCQAYQMRQNRCELLDDDRISAPEDFLEEKEYTYYDMNREYVNHQVTNQYCQSVHGFANGKKVDRESFWLLLSRFFLIRLTNAFLLYSFLNSSTIVNKTRL